LDPPSAAANTTRARIANPAVLVHAIENIAVRCRPCNSQRGNTAYTITEAIDVLARLQAAYRRRPTKTGCEHINAAQRAIQTRADAPSATLHTRDAKAQAALHTALEGAV